MLDNPTSNLLAIVTAVTVLRQGWDVLYWIMIILYRCCNLQVLQQVAPNGRCISQTVKQGCASVHIVKQQTATFQTTGPESVHLYATHHRLTCIIHTDVYNLDLHILTYTPVWVILSYIDTLPEKTALLKPFALVVNKERWEVPANSGHPRALSAEKQAEVVRQIDELKAHVITEISTTSCHSQVLLVVCVLPIVTWIAVGNQLHGRLLISTKCYVESERRNLRFLVQWILPKGTSSPSSDKFSYVYSFISIYSAAVRTWEGSFLFPRTNCHERGITLTALANPEVDLVG